MTASSFHQRLGAQSQRSTRRVGAALTVAALGLTSAVTSSAGAQAVVPDCREDLPGLSELANAAPRIWGRGGSAPNLLVGTLAVELQESDDPLVVIYKDDGACYAMNALVDNEPLSGSLKYWYRNAETRALVTATCTLSGGTIPATTWGSMAQLADSCGVELPANVYDGVGPISGFSILVPVKSTQQAISAEAVYYIYGLGLGDPKYHVAPWTVPAAIGSRATTSAAGLLLAKAVGIPLDHTLQGIDVKTNGAMVVLANDQAKSGNAEASIGFASTETVDAARKEVRSLAFQARGQNRAYWPDSTSTSFDKLNIREGRYFLWNPHHFYARLDAPNGKIADPNVRRWINILTKGEALPAGSRSFLDVQIEAGNVPECAMRVKRDGDVGPLASYQPEVSCGCYYDTNVKGGSGVSPEHCEPCVNADGPELPGEAKDATCPSETPYCRYGFCEVK